MKSKIQTDDSAAQMFERQVQIKDNHTVDIIREDDGRISIKLTDLDMQTTQTLAWYQDGKYSFPHLGAERLFFKTLKEYPKVNRIMQEMFAPIRVDSSVEVSYECLLRRFKFWILKLKRFYDHTYFVYE